MGFSSCYVAGLAVLRWLWVGLVTVTWQALLCQCRLGAGFITRDLMCLQTACFATVVSAYGLVTVACALLCSVYVKPLLLN